MNAEQFNIAVLALIIELNEYSHHLCMNLNGGKVWLNAAQSPKCGPPEPHDWTCLIPIHTLDNPLQRIDFSASSSSALTSGCTAFGPHVQPLHVTTEQNNTPPAAMAEPRIRQIKIKTGIVKRWGRFVVIHFQFAVVSMSRKLPTS